MVTSKGLKRNSVVAEARPAQYRFYGRVWKVLDEHHVLVLDSGQHLTKYHENDLVVTDYRGMKTRNHFIKMSNLRRLLLLAKEYNPTLEPRTYEPNK